MKPRATKDLQRTLQAKGFRLNPDKGHHQYYVLEVDGKRSRVSTYFSHGGKEYGSYLMQQVKKQLRFRDTATAEAFFDCPLTFEAYVQLLRDQGDL